MPTHIFLCLRIIYASVILVVMDLLLYQVYISDFDELMSKPGLLGAIGILHLVFGATCLFVLYRSIAEGKIIAPRSQNCTCQYYSCICDSQSRDSEGAV